MVCVALDSLVTKTMHKMKVKSMAPATCGRLGLYASCANTRFTQTGVLGAYARRLAAISADET